MWCVASMYSSILNSKLVHRGATEQLAVERQVEAPSTRGNYTAANHPTPPPFLNRNHLLAEPLPQRRVVPAFFAALPTALGTALLAFLAIFPGFDLPSIIE